MRLRIALGIVMLAAGCADGGAPTEFAVPLYAKGGNGDLNIGAHLTGDEEVFAAPAGALTPADSRAQGQAIFRVSDDERTVSFKLIATNIDNVIMAHIHCAPPGVNGGIRMWLYPVTGPAGAPAPAGAGRHTGILAEGEFSPVGINCPATAAMPAMPLLDAIRTGFAYVNIHTNDGVGAANTGPGDFQSGELRGQLGR